MILVEVYSKPGCHLCDVMKDALEKERARTPFELREIMIEEGTPEYDRFSERVPVVFVDGEYRFQYHFNRVAFENALRTHR